MATKTASVTLDGDGLRFVGRVGSGHAIVLDNTEGDTGARPAELVPLALAGCTAMDVISILRKKRQLVTRYEVRTAGVQSDEHPNEFRRIEVLHDVEGEVEAASLARAIELSATKYCSVGSTLATGVTEIHHAYRLRTPDGAETEADVLVMGPHADVRAQEPAGAAS
ncbi:MAG: OsmC family protein [Chloroflexi bacterium]|nr:OsmC family protein [Chloroflexota bacterium]